MLKHTFMLRHTRCEMTFLFPVWAMTSHFLFLWTLTDNPDVYRCCVCAHVRAEEADPTCRVGWLSLRGGRGGRFRASLWDNSTLDNKTSVSSFLKIHYAKKLCAYLYICVCVCVCVCVPPGPPRSLPVAVSVYYTRGPGRLFVPPSAPGCWPQLSSSPWDTYTHTHTHLESISAQEWCLSSLALLSPPVWPKSACPEWTSCSLPGAGERHELSLPVSGQELGAPHNWQGTWNSVLTDLVCLQSGFCRWMR